MPYGDHWRRVRKLFANVLTAKKCDSYVVVQEREAIATLYNIRERADNFAVDLERYALSVARSVAYGRRVQSPDDPFAIQVKTIMDHAADSLTPGKYVFEFIPALRKLPRSLQPWMDKLEKYRDYEQNFSLENHRSALALAEKHPERPCIARDIDREVRVTGEVNELQAATISMDILGAGADTTAYSLLFMVQACLAYPEVVEKAHEELDRVIGHDRFPTWSDEPDLPYIRAIIKEQHRWRTIAPMSFAHYAEEEDAYNSYRIPKGSIVTINTWSIHMDPFRYPEPEKFVPERFLNHPLSAAAYANTSDVEARDHFSYGGGRRICVGMHLAERSLFTLTARLLHTFDIKPALDNKGNEIPVDMNAVRTSLIMAPEPFQARFIVRSAAIGKLLDREWKELFGKGPVDSWYQ
ncbi:hypothetical protein LTR93_012109 [Exophiala xenobiotica]|nr:hypothetical protein LTR93_012109 [Exophiala xenobiotica]